MATTRGLVSERRQFSLKDFLKSYKEGWLMIMGQCREYWLEWRARCRASRAKSSAHDAASSEQPKRASCAMLELGEKQEELENGAHEQYSGTLLYGLGCLSRIFCVMLLYGPAFVFDPRPGLLPSKRFLYSYYMTLLLGVLLSVFVAKFILEPTLIDVLPGMTKSMVQLIAFTTTSSEIILILYGLGSLFSVVYHHRFMRDFMLYHGNVISLPKSYQRRKAVELFLSYYTLTILSKPLFISLTVICDPKQPKKLNHWSPAAFALARASVILLTTAGSIVICTSGMVVPFMSTFLITFSAGHLKNFFHKHLARFDRTVNKLSSCSRPRQDQNPRIVALLDERTRRLISEYSCSTLTQDWPQFMSEHNEYQQADGYSDEGEEDDLDGVNTGLQSTERQTKGLVRTQAANIKALSVSCYGACSDTYAQNAGQSPFTRARTNSKQCATALCWSQSTREGAGSRFGSLSRNSHTNAEAVHYNSAANSLLFLYKNLIKSLSELKGMIGVYERKFGTFHLMQICIDSLIVAQWITTSLTESRLREESRLEPLTPAASANVQSVNATSLSSVPASKSEISLLAIEATIGVFSFIISNTYIFLRCDCLPDCMMKMRSKLFKMNIELAHSALRPGSAQPTGSGQFPAKLSRRSSQMAAVCSESSFKSAIASQKLTRSQSVGLMAADQSAELDQVWSLFDQVVRMSELANFKLTAGTYYSKRCLLWIFGRTVSLTLLCIQIIDIYSYT